MCNGYLVSIKVPWDSYQKLLSNLQNDSGVILVYSKQDPAGRISCLEVIVRGDPDFLELRIKKAYQGFPDELKITHKPINVPGGQHV